MSDGGKVFKDASGKPSTRRVTQEEISKTIPYLEDLTDLDFSEGHDDEGYPIKWLGSTGRGEDSGDIDLSVDSSEITKEQLIEKLKSAGVDSADIKKSGDNVHLKTPIGGDPQNGFAQTDFMFSDDTEWQRFIMHGGEAKHILLASLARHKGLKYSYKNGLIDESSGEATKDPNKIAKTLLGQMANPKHILTVEGILSVIQKLPDYDQMVAQARETLAKKGIALPESEKIESYQTGTPEWFRRMMEACK
jgi:hypothetical protein